MSDLIRVGIPIAVGNFLVGWIWYCAGVRHERRVMAARLDELSAYARDPLPEPDWTPIWAIQKTPGQEGG